MVVSVDTLKCSGPASLIGGGAAMCDENHFSSY